MFYYGPQAKKQLDWGRENSTKLSILINTEDCCLTSQQAPPPKRPLVGLGKNKNYIVDYCSSAIVLISSGKDQEDRSKGDLTCWVETAVFPSLCIADPFLGSKITSLMSERLFRQDIFVDGQNDI